MVVGGVAGGFRFQISEMRLLTSILSSNEEERNGTLQASLIADI
jgi:hypothetical protein